MNKMKTYDLYKILKEELRNGSSDLVTRQSGQAVRERIERDILKEPEGEIIAIDFSRIGIIDYSCADEIVAKLISRLVNGEYGNRFIVLTGLNENQKENIEVALERKSISTIAVMKNKKKVIIGSLNNYLVETLDIINQKGSISARELSKILGLELNTAATRLLNLYKKRLITRTIQKVTEGKAWVYKSII